MAKEVEAGGSSERNWGTKDQGFLPSSDRSSMWPCYLTSEALTWEVFAWRSGKLPLHLFAWLQGWVCSHPLLNHSSVITWLGRFYKNTTVGEFSETVICPSVFLSLQKRGSASQPRAYRVYHYDQHCREYKLSIGAGEIESEASQVNRGLDSLRLTSTYADLESPTGPSETVTKTTASLWVTTP